MLCYVFLRSPLYLIPHFAFPLCAALVIIFLRSELAFDMQAPNILAALQMNCISQQCALSLSFSHCLFSTVFSTALKQDLNSQGSVNCLILNVIQIRDPCVLEYVMLVVVT